MKSLKISDELHQRLKVEAAGAGVALQELVTCRLVGPVEVEQVVEVAKPVLKRKKVELPANPEPVPLEEKKVEEVAIKPTRWCGVCARLVDSWKMKDGLAICERHWKDLE